jgi:hypothetical protein
MPHGFRNTQCEMVQLLNECRTALLCESLRRVGRSAVSITVMDTVSTAQDDLVIIVTRLSVRIHCVRSRRVWCKTSKTPPGDQCPRTLDQPGPVAVAVAELLSWCVHWLDDAYVAGIH